jgi:hypothetical protein
MKAKFITLVQQLIAAQGRDALFNIAKCKAFLAATQSQNINERRLLQHVVESGITSGIMNASNVAAYKPQAVQKLQTDYYYAPNVANDVVDILIGLIKTAPPAQVQPPAAATRTPVYQPPAYQAPVQQAAPQIQQPQYAPYSPPVPQAAPPQVVVIQQAAQQYIPPPRRGIGESIEKRTMGQFFWNTIGILFVAGIVFTISMAMYYNGEISIEHLFGITVIALVIVIVVSCNWFNKLARDMNTLCAGDGRKTRGVLALIFLSLITAGIYNLFWIYAVADRLQDNAPRYQLSFKESGGTVFTWYFFGVLILIGPFIALHIIIKNINALADVYNKIP